MLWRPLPGKSVAGPASEKTAARPLPSRFRSACSGVRVRAPFIAALPAILCLATPGCLLKRHRRGDEPATPSRAEVDGFEVTDEVLGLEVVENDGRKRFRVLNVQFLSDRPSGEENRLVRGTCYLPRTPKGAAPAVLVFPILKGGEPFSKGLGKSLAKAGFVSFVFKQKKALFGNEGMDLRFSDRVLRQMILDARKAVTWLQSRPEVRGDRIGAVGISMGGIVASLVHALEPRITSSVWMLAGGDLVEVLAMTREPSLRRKREHHFSQTGLDTASYVAANRGLLTDPLDYVDRIDASRVMMVTGLFDRVVPRRNSRLLWEAAGKPELRLVPLGHFSSLLVFPLSKRWVVDFFRRELGGSSGGVRGRVPWPRKAAQKQNGRG